MVLTKGGKHLKKEHCPSKKKRGLLIHKAEPGHGKSNMRTGVGVPVSGPLQVNGSTRRGCKKKED